MTDVKSLESISVADTGALLTRLEADLTPRLYRREDPVYVTPQALAEDADNSERTAVEQCLQDLGYLPELAAPRPFTRSERSAALAHWRRDTRLSNTRYRLPGRKPRKGKKRSNAEPSVHARELDLSQPLPWLLRQTGFEGGMECLRMPAQGETGLVSRLLLYRLKTFNRYENDVASPLGQHALDTLQRLKQHTGFTDIGDLALLNRLGNADALCRRFASTYSEQVFVYADDSSPGTDDVAALRFKRRSAWEYPSGRPYKGTLNPKRRPRSVRARRIQDFKVGEPQANAPTFRECYCSEENTLGLELLQLKLWQHGYYTGAIDADWGSFSVAALNHLLTSEDTFQSTDTLLFPVAGGFAVNLQSLFTVQLPAVERLAAGISDGDAATVRAAVLDAEEEEWEPLSQGADRLCKSEPDPRVGIAVTTRRRGDAPDSAMQTRRRRRFNFAASGLKRALFGIWKTVTRVTGKIIDTVKKTARAVRDAIVQAAEHVRGLLRGLLSIFKPAVRVAKAAIKRLYYWLAGVPFGSGDAAAGQVVATKWSLDFDALTYIADGTPAALLQQHNRRIEFMNDSFRFMTRLALTVVRVLAAVATWNWLKVLRLVFVTATSLDTWRSEENPFRYLDAEGELLAA